MARFFTSLFAVVAMTFSLTASADSRDDAYDQLLREAHALADVDLGTPSGVAELRGHAARLARLMTVFVVKETEIRSEEKVAPPSTLGLISDASNGSGTPTAIAEVPTPWFNARIFEARDSVRSLLSAIDQGKLDAGLLMRTGDETLAALIALGRP